MKRVVLIALGATALLVLPSMVQRANPILEGYFNELMFTPSGWRLEMHALMPANLDGWSLRSSHGQATFRNGIAMGGAYVVVTAESLLTPLVINPYGDSLTLFSGQYPMAFLWFGWAGMAAAPRPGQSLCLLEGGGVYYLDNSPTPGFPNDATNAMGTVNGVVTDTSGMPIAGVRVDFGEMFPVYSNASGVYSITEYATRTYLAFSRTGFQPEYRDLQIWPESTVVLNVVMDFVVGVEEELPRGIFGLKAAYPNPSNPAVHFEIVLPSRSHARLVLYDVAGREVAMVADGEMEAGVHSVLFEGTGLASGVYLARFEWEGRIATQKVVLVR